MNEICAPPGWAKRAVASCEPGAPVELLLAMLETALRAELAVLFRHVDFGVRDAGSNIIVTWVGGPVANEVGAGLSFECISESGEVLLLQVMSFESPEWPAPIDMLNVVLKRTAS